MDPKGPAGLSCAPRHFDRPAAAREAPRTADGERVAGADAAFRDGTRRKPPGIVLAVALLGASLVPAAAHRAPDAAGRTPRTRGAGPRATGRDDRAGRLPPALRRRALRAEPARRGAALGAARRLGLRRRFAGDLGRERERLPPDLGRRVLRRLGRLDVGRAVLAFAGQRERADRTRPRRSGSDDDEAPRVPRWRPPEGRAQAPGAIRVRTTTYRDALAASGDLPELELPDAPPVEVWARSDAAASSSSSSSSRRVVMRWPGSL